MVLTFPILADYSVFPAADRLVYATHGHVFNTSHLPPLCPGDIYVNIHGMTAAQSAYNQYAPILMTSVDTDPALCAAERKAVFARLTPGDWQIFGAHGAKKDVSVPDPA